MSVTDKYVETTADIEAFLKHWNSVNYTYIPGTEFNTAYHTARAAWFAALSQPIQSGELNEPTAELVERLTDYALDPGYSHNDYADTMKQAASCIGQLVGCVELYQRKYAEASATAPVAAIQPAGDAVAKLWGRNMLMGVDIAASIAHVQHDASEAGKLARILFGLCEGGGLGDDIDIYADDFQAADGDVYVYRAAELLLTLTAENRMLGALTDLLGNQIANDKSKANPSPSIIADWPACNPGCDYETPHGSIQDCRNASCSCDPAKASIARQSAALAARSAPVQHDASELPPLPKAERELIELHQPAEYTTHVCSSARYTADQMRSYASAARSPQAELLRAHVEKWAINAGWTDTKEGAFEFAQRTCYRQGWDDAVAQLKLKEGQQ